jgi:2-polyprenyl-3-methyl-5-hydroxy-6-metoxy-1,4-benzoquinol methylase
MNNLTKRGDSVVDPKDQEALYDGMDQQLEYLSSVVLELVLEYRWSLALSLLPKDGLFLDIGCSYGEIMHHVSRKASKVVGVDISGKQVELAKQQDYACSMECYHENFLNFAYPDKFDLITAFEVIEHVLDPNQFLIKIGSMLKPKGLAVLSTPNWNSIDRRFKRFFPIRMFIKLLGGQDWSNPYLLHVQEFTIPEIMELVDKNGMVVEELRSLNIIPFLVTLGKIIPNRRLMKGLLGLGRTRPQWCVNLFYVIRNP